MVASLCCSTIYVLLPVNEGTAGPGVRQGRILNKAVRPTNDSVRDPVAQARAVSGKIRRQIAGSSSLGRTALLEKGLSLFRTAQMPRKEPRNYAKEYDEYHGKQKQIDNRNSRNKAVRKKGREGKRDGKEVDHIDGNPRNNSNKNLRVVKRTTNRRKG